MLFVGDDWAEDHHDVELQDPTGRRVGKARLEEGIAGIARLHAMVGEQLGDDAEPAQVMLGIETDRGPWVQALIAAGYQVYVINPLQVARYRERHAVSGAKSDAGDAHTLADMVRTDRHQLRPVAGDSEQAEALKVVSRAHQTLIWERTRHTLRLRQTLREFFPAALAAFDDLAAGDTLGTARQGTRPSRGGPADHHPDNRGVAPRAPPPWQGSKLVFTTTAGTPVDPRNFNRSWDARCVKAGLRKITVHDARRTCGSLLADLDVHPRVAMAILRHARFSITMEIYTQVSSAATREALKRLGDSLDG